MKLYCATKNPGKLREFRLGLPQVETLPRLEELREPEETGATFEANAILKAGYYGRHADGLLFADDSGLEVDALAGAPGVFSARYAGVTATDEQNNELLLRNLQGRADRAARFVCAIALVRGDFVLGTFRGVVEGEILEEPRGPGGFGYDPLFWYPPAEKSFGEMSAEDKFAVSHRGKALRALRDFLRVTPGFPRV